MPSQLTHSPSSSQSPYLTQENRHLAAPCRSGLSGCNSQLTAHLLSLQLAEPLLYPRNSLLRTVQDSLAGTRSSQQLTCSPSSLQSPSLTRETCQLAAPCRSGLSMFDSLFTCLRSSEPLPYPENSLLHAIQDSASQTHSSQAAQLTRSLPPSCSRALREPLPHLSSVLLCSIHGKSLSDGAEIILNTKSCLFCKCI